MKYLVHISTFIALIVILNIGCAKQNTSSHFESDKVSVTQSPHPLPSGVIPYPTKVVSSADKHISPIAKKLVHYTTSPSSHDKRKIEVSQIDGTIFYNTTLDEVKSENNAILCVTPTQDFLSRSHPYTLADDGTTGYAWTEGTFTITNVLYVPAGYSLSVGQNITLAEPVGLRDYGSDGLIKLVKEECYEMKQNSQYVAFVYKDEANTMRLANFNIGRFNTDGTDIEDEILSPNGLVFGQKTAKQKLREELTAAYGVTFAVPTTVAPTITSFSPAQKSQGEVDLSLTVQGNDFKNGAVVTFNNVEKPTTFLSATSLKSTIATTDIQQAGNFAVTVTNPDGKISSSKTFTVGPPKALPSLASLTWQRTSTKLIATVSIKNSGGLTLTNFTFTSAKLTQLTTP